MPSEDAKTPVQKVVNFTMTIIGPPKHRAPGVSVGHTAMRSTLPDEDLTGGIRWEVEAKGRKGKKGR